MGLPGKADDCQATEQTNASLVATPILGLATLFFLMVNHAHYRYAFLGLAIFLLLL